MRRSLLASALGVLLLFAAPFGCERGLAPRLAEPPKYDFEGQSRCHVEASLARPLVVEWPAADRASLEARLSAGLVAVRAEGCEIEVLRRCTVPGTYAYRGLTRKNDQVVINNTDDLYLHLPIGAARLEGKLARSGELDVRMALVGMLEAPADAISSDKLRGECEGATHMIAGVQVGAFEFVAAGRGELGAGVDVVGVGAGGSAASSREVLSADGDPKRCDASTTADARPPEGCGAVIRIELARLGAPSPPPRLDPMCPSGSRWDGRGCVVTETYCPDRTRPIDGQCVESPATPTLSPPAEDCPEGTFYQPGHGCESPVATEDRTKKYREATKDEKHLCHRLCFNRERCRSAEDRDVPEQFKGIELSSCKEVCERRITNSVRRDKWQRCSLSDCNALGDCFFGGL